MDLKTLVNTYKDQIIKARRDLHQIPEIACNEVKTSSYIVNYLQNEALDVQTGIAQHGVVGLLGTDASGPTLLIRADMDALPLKEATGLPFASTHDGMMHACGHDAHVAMVLGAATVLNRLKDKFKGTLKFVFQPAEEGPGGALPMIEAGVMQHPTVDYSVGCHVWPAVPAGSIGVKTGVLMAAMDRFDLKIIGRGGHGAMPHLCVDALEVGCQVINALQRITSRQADPLNPTVVTVGQFKAGTNFNIIPDTAEMCGTTRTFDRDIWESWPQRLEKIISGVCQSMGAQYELNFSKGYPPVVNDAFMADVVRDCAAEAVGPDNVVEPARTMGGEDMAYFLEQSQGCFFCLGAGKEGGFPIHNPRFDFNEDILLDGVEIFCRVALQLLR
ncbi:amidohydrolase [Desulfococcaceae bacterium HSG7]|nr:amidohydrolase [Desulfococcaceae bacterium HSG7]